MFQDAAKRTQNRLQANAASLLKRPWVRTMRPILFFAVSILGTLQTLVLLYCFTTSTNMHSLLKEDLIMGTGEYNYNYSHDYHLVTNNNPEDDVKNSKEQKIKKVPPQGLVTPLRADHHVPTNLSMSPALPSMTMRQQGEAHSSSRNSYENDRNIHSRIERDGDDEQKSHTVDSVPTHHQPKRCIAIGIFSRASEFTLRQWHREIYQTHANAHRYSRDVKIDLLFGLARPIHDAVMQGIQLEMKLTNAFDDDLVVFDFDETEECMHRNRCLTRNADALLRSMRSKLCQESNHTYEASYFLKMDDDVVLNYELLARVFLHFPTQSVQFGRFFPNVPTAGAYERNLASLSHGFYPLWSQGAFRGFSKDILDLTLLPNNTATIYRQEQSYFFYESDRAAGILLDRAQISVRHAIFTKGYYFMCSTNDIVCEYYRNTIAFHIGFGLSGDNDDHIKSKLDLLKQVFGSILECYSPDSIFDPNDHYFLVDDSFRQSNASKWLEYGCSSVENSGRHLIESFQNLSEHAIQSELDGVNNETCAEEIYHQRGWDGPASLNVSLSFNMTTAEHSTIIFANTFMKKLRTMPNYEQLPGKSHYISGGYASDGAQYYCPQFQSSSMCKLDCKNCDQERAYLEQYPDVKEAIDAGRFSDGLAHFKFHGRNEGRIYPCLETDETSYHDNGRSDECHAVFSSFIDQSSHLIKKWPIQGNAEFHISSPQCNAAVFIEWFDHPWMDYILRLHRRYLGPYWVFNLIGPKSLTDLWHKKYHLPMIKIIDLPDEFADSHAELDNYNHLLVSKFLWESVVQCENVLITGANNFIYRHGVEDFLHYDFVGSPLYPDQQGGANPFWKIMAAFQNTWGGDGHLSVRKRSTMIKLIESCPLTSDNYPEEVWTSACIMILDGKLPRPAVSNRFSIGNRCDVDVPFGSHQLWKACGKEPCSIALLSSRLHRDLYGEDNMEWNCKEGMMLYLHMYQHAKQDIEANRISSAWDHFNQVGRQKGYIWRCHQRFNLNHMDQFLASNQSCMPRQNRRRLELIHIPKTGGTTLEILAAKFNVTWGACHWIQTLVGKYHCPYNTNKPRSNSNLYHSILRASKWHLPIKYIYDEPNPYHGADIFVVVRNPYTRLISEWNYIPPEKEDIMQGLDINNAEHMNTWISMQIKRHLDSAPGSTNYHEHLDSHLVPQYAYVEGMHDRVHVLRMENLEQEFNCLMMQYGYKMQLKHDNLHLNKGTGTLTIANLTNSTKLLIQKAYAKDFETFGYPL